MKILLAGCGKIASRLGIVLYNSGNAVLGVRRQATPLLFPVLSGDLNDKNTLARQPLDFDIIVFTVTPEDRNESAYEKVYTTILDNVIDFAKRHQKPPLLILISSSGVYAQQNGQWVDENSPTNPTQYSGKWILHGENQLKKNLQNRLIVRFSGIYSSQRRWMIKHATSGKTMQKEPPVWSNRIHEDDCVGALNLFIHLYQKNSHLDKCYLVSDDCPVERYEVAEFICQTLDITPPPIKKNNLTHDYNKRCRNHKIKALGYEFIYPTFKDGYREILTLS